MTKFNEETIQAIVKAVVVAIDALQPEEKDEIRYEDYAAVESVKTYKQADDYPTMLSIKEAAAMLNVCYAKAYELFRSKDFPCVIWGKSSRRVDKADLIQYIKERRGGYIIAPGDDDA